MAANAMQAMPAAVAAGSGFCPLFKKACLPAPAILLLLRKNATPFKRMHSGTLFNINTQGTLAHSACPAPR